jgi:hypothetical protein
MSHSTKLKGEIAWLWPIVGRTTPDWIAGDVVSAFHHPDGTILIDFKWVDQWGEGCGSLRLRNLAGTDQFVGKGIARQGGSQHEIAAVRCELVRDDKTCWQLRGTFWREEIKETDQWKASLTIVAELPWEEDSKE